MIKLPEKTLTALCLASAEKYKNRLALAMIRDGKITRRITYAQMGSRSMQIGMLLRQIGVENGGRVLLLSDNSPEWVLAYFGIAFAGGVSVPLLTGFSEEQIQHIAQHAEVSAICMSKKLAENLRGSWITNQKIILIDTITDAADNAAEITVLIDGEKKQLCFPVAASNETASFPKRAPDDLATIIYTSGTQGSSKGVMLSGTNLVFSAFSSMDFIKIHPRDRMLSVLPLAHSYECSLGLLAPVISGASVTYLDKPPSPSVLLPAVKTLRPTAMITVPLLIEKIYNRSIEPKLRGSKLYRFPLTRPLAIRAAGRKLKNALGGQIRFFGIGGSALAENVETFLHKAKFPYSIGYGLTEAAPLVAGLKPYRLRARSALKTPKGVSIRIARTVKQKEGEIQVKGPNIMLGYYNDKERTAETLTPDGWLHTGDLGHLDKKGRLHIRGRLKALILGPSGENIYPEEIEGLLGSSQLVEDALVYSGEKGELVALVFLSDAAKAAAGAVEHALEELKAWTNKKLAVFSRLSRIDIKGEPFEKTPTMKIKRYLYI